MGIALTEEKGQFEAWAVLELMGHRRLGGFVREVTIAGAGMLRIPPAALYCLTPCTEATARTIGENARPRSIATMALPEPEYSGGGRYCDDDDPAF